MFGLDELLSFASDVPSVIVSVNASLFPAVCEKPKLRLLDPVAKPKEKVYCADPVKLDETVDTLPFVIELVKDVELVFPGAA